MGAGRRDGRRLGGAGMMMSGTTRCVGAERMAHAPAGLMRLWESLLLQGWSLMEGVGSTYVWQHGRSASARADAPTRSQCVSS